MGEHEIHRNSHQSHQWPSSGHRASGRGTYGQQLAGPSPIGCPCCAVDCPGCEAEKLAVNCGCQSEAKQYEYDVSRHGEHGGGGHDMSKASHADHEAAMSNPEMAAWMEADMRRRFFIAFLLSIPILIYSPVSLNYLRLSPPEPIPANWILLILTTPVVFYSGSIFITGAYHSLRNQQLNMSVLIAVGVLASYVFSVALTPLGQETFYEAAALLVTFVLFGHWMEMKSRRGTSEALRALFELVPPKATVVRDGKEQVIPSTEIAVGDIILLRPGDKVPVDGLVTDGETSVDEALVTGESLPVSKRPGDEVIGGSINQMGSIKFQAVKVGSDTVLAQIVRLVETAQSSKAPGQRIADRAAAYLVVLAVGAGILTFGVWYLGQGVSLLAALTFAVSTVVIACPDALGLATPTAVAVGSGIGAKNNVLIKDAATLERVNRIQAIVLDKTGTLTEGEPKVIDVVATDSYSEAEVLAWAASAESRSNHPLSLAVNERAREEGLAVADVTEFEALAGHGIAAKVDGKRVLAGTAKLMEDRGLSLAKAKSSVDTLLAEGKTLILVAVDDDVVGVIGCADQVKPTARAAVAGLRDLGIEVAMITGDNRQTAENVAAELGIERVFAEVLPEKKAVYVKELQREGKFTAMVGDGINDAPALAQADIGIAIGAGTDVAIATANVVLMKSDPADVLVAIRLSKATVRKMKQNLFWAVFYNVLAIPVAAGVFYNSLGLSLRPEMSALLMSASSIIVAVNAVSLKRVEGRLRD